MTRTVPRARVTAFVTFRLGYAVATGLLLAIEAVIAATLHDAVVRPYVGDSLAVVLVHVAVRAVARVSVGVAVTTALCVAAAVECSQWVHFVDLIGLGAYPVARAVLGTGFDPLDFVAYLAGGVAVIAVEAQRRRRTR